MENISEEDGSMETIDVNQEDCKSQIPSDANKEDKNEMETELQNKPPYSVNKELCLHSNHYQFGITKLDTVSICFICKTVIHFSKLDPCNKNHLSSNEHKLNQFELFKQCFYNPGFNNSNSIQNYVLNNSSIDFSSATEISNVNVSANCFVCKIEIPSLRRSEDVWIADVLHHLKDENHIRNVQDNFSWTCLLPSREHMTFYKTLFYCSMCEDSISCDECDLIPTAVSHLETQHSEGFISHGFEVETTSHSSDSTACDGSFDFDNTEEISDDLYSTCEDESSFVEVDAYLTADSYEVSLPKVEDEETEVDKHEVLSYVCIESVENMEMVGDGLENLQKIKDGETENNKHEVLSYVCIESEEHTEMAKDDLENLSKIKDEEAKNNKPQDLSYVCIDSGENMETIGEDLEVKVQLHSVSYDKENSDALILPAQKCHKESSFTSKEIKVKTLDNHGSAINRDCKGFPMDDHPKVLIEELSNCNADNMPKGNKNKDHKQTNLEQKCLTKTNIYENKKLFSNLYDCLPTSFHKDLSFVTIKSNQFHCELCICSIGIVLNIFDSTFILHSHFCLIYHRNQMDIIFQQINENKKPKVKQNFSNTKIQEKKIIIRSNITEEKLTDKNKINQRNHVPPDSTKTANSQTNMASNNTSSEDKNISDLQNILSKRPIVKKQADLDIISSIAISKVQKQNEVHDIISNIQTFPKQTKVKVIPSSPLKPTQISKEKKVFDLQDFSSIAISKVKKQNAIHDIFSNIQTFPKQTELKAVPSSPLKLALLSTEKKIFDLQDISTKRPIVKKHTELDIISSIPISKVQKQNEIHDVSGNIPKQTEVKVVPSSPLIPTKINNEMDITKLKTLLPSHKIDLFSDPNLRVHQGFFKHTRDCIYCCLCSSDVGENPIDLKNHITGITHKVQFLSQLKKSLKKQKRYQLKFLIFMNGHLYCSLCKCFVPPYDSFVGICEEVKAHFEMDAHSTYDGENQIKSGETCQEIMSLNKKIIMAGAEIPSDSSNLMTNETKGAKNENKQKIRNVLLYTLSQKSHGALVENPPKASKLEVDISNHSNSGLLNNGTLPSEPMKQKPVEELAKDSQANNIDIPSSKFDESIKTDLSLKRLIATEPLVRVNKDFIEQVGANFYCILCSICIPFSPQKYVLAKNFNFHFKSASHISTVNKISKVGNIPRISQIIKRKDKKTCRLTIDESSNTAEKTLCSKACDKFNMEKVSSNVPSLPMNGSQFNESKVNPTSSEKVNKKYCLKVSTNRTSALKRFMKKYKLDKSLNLFENNISNVISNKQASQKLHPLLQKLVPDVPLLQLNKQHILRRNINFYCKLCCKDISFSTKHHVLARYFNAHFKSMTHTSLLQTENSGLQHEKQASVNHSTKCPSMTNRTMFCQLHNTASNSDRGLCNVLNEGKTVFKPIYNNLINLKNEEIFFCNYCIKHIRTIPYKSFEYSIVQHCFKTHKEESKLQHGGIVSDVIWKNNVLKANVMFMEVSHEAAACGICCAAVNFSKNYSTLILNFFMHFQDEKHKLYIRSTRQSNSLPNVGGKSKKYKPNLKAYEGN